MQFSHFSKLAIRNWILKIHQSAECNHLNDIFEMRFRSSPLNKVLGLG